MGGYIIIIIIMCCFYPQAADNMNTYRDIQKICTTNKKRYPSIGPCNAKRDVLEKKLKQVGLFGPRPTPEVGRDGVAVPRKVRESGVAVPRKVRESGAAVPRKVRESGAAVRLQLAVRQRMRRRVRACNNSSDLSFEPLQWPIFRVPSGNCLSRSDVQELIKHGLLKDPYTNVELSDAEKERIRPPKDCAGGWGVFCYFASFIDTHPWIHELV